jgi:acyl-CoA oxidase
VFNAAQDHLLAAARAHVDSVLLHAFIGGIERCDDGAERALLERVCDLFVLSTIEAERGWFQEHGRRTRRRGTQSRARGARSGRSGGLTVEARLSPMCRGYLFAQQPTSVDRRWVFAGRPVSNI